MSGTVKTPQKFAATLSTDPAIREIQTYLLQQNQSVLNNPILAAADWRWAQEGTTFALQFRTPPQDWNTVASFNSSGELSTDSGDGADGYVPLSLFTTAGDLPVGTGAGAVTRLGSGAVGTFLGGTGIGSAPTYQSLSSGSAVPWAPDLIDGVGPYAAALLQWSAAATMTWEGVWRDVVGLRPTEVAGGGVANSSINSIFRVKRYTSGGSDGNLAGMSPSGGNSYIQRSALWALVGTGATLTSQRIWVGVGATLTGGTFNGYVPPTTATALAGYAYAFAYDPAVSANWLCVTGDGTNWSGTDSGVAVTASTAWAMSISNTTWGTTTFKIQGWNTWTSLSSVPSPTVVNKTTNIPSGIGGGNVTVVEAFLRNTSASARTFDINYLAVRGP